MGLFLGFSFYQVLAWLLETLFQQRTQIVSHNTVRMRVEYD